MRHVCKSCGTEFECPWGFPAYCEECEEHLLDEEYAEMDAMTDSLEAEQIPAWEHGDKT